MCGSLPRLRQRRRLSSRVAARSEFREPRHDPLWTLRARHCAAAVACRRRAGDPRLAGLRGASGPGGAAAARVGKAELLDLVWPGLVVEENNLQVQISALRKVLGPAAIATVPGRGYRFAVATNDAEPAQPPAAPPACPGRRCTRQPARSRFAASSAATRTYGRARRAHRSEPSRDRVGPAGVGKTALAMASAEAARERWPDGVWIVELAALATAPRSRAAVMETLQIAVGDRERAVESLVDILAGRRLLLVLDNCEHLLDAVAHARRRDQRARARRPCARHEPATAQRTGRDRDAARPA